MIQNRYPLSRLPSINSPNIEKHLERPAIISHFNIIRQHPDDKEQLFGNERAALASHSKSYALGKIVKNQRDFLIL